MSNLWWNKEVGFEHCHLHSDLSILDGYGTVEEYAARAKLINQQYLCVSDHGMMAAIPRQIRACEKHKLSPIFACELYLQPGHTSREDFLAMDAEQKKAIRKSYHLLAIAYNETGYKNLVQLSSWAWLNGFYYKPRVNYCVLEKHKAGLIFTSCCYNSEVGQAFDRGGKEEADEVVRRYMGMFGDDFYLEFMLLDFVKQKPYNAYIVDAASRFNLPIILTNDCFVKGTLVNTDVGLKYIEDIVVGDRVLTHEGRYQEVEIVGKRLLRDSEKVFRVTTSCGSYAFEATANHKVRYCRKGENGLWSFDWKEVGSLTDGDHLIISTPPDPSLSFKQEDARELDVLPYLKPDEYQIGTETTKPSRAGNNNCRLMLEGGLLLSFRGFNRSSPTAIPSRLTLDDALLSIIGWYIAEGWTDKTSWQVGFGLHEEEVDVANFIAGYFARFGIKSKISKASRRGIRVVFASKVFSLLFSRLCGKGAGNKRLPSFGTRFLSSRQWGVVLQAILDGDGHCRERSYGFYSTSRILIYEIASLLCHGGIVGLPCVQSHSDKNWADTWSVNYGGERKDDLLRWLKTGERQTPRGFMMEAVPGGIAVPFWSRKEIPYTDDVYDFQVAEDHSFVANLYQSSNCHYCQREDSLYQRYMLMIQKNTTVQEIEQKLQAEDKAEIFELQDQNLWMKSELELNEKWFEMYQDVIPFDVFQEAKRNTVRIAQRCAGVKIDRSVKLPRIPDAEDKFKEALKEGFKSRGLHLRPDRKVYQDRLAEELDLIRRKEFCSYFLIQKQIVDEARRAAPGIMGWGDGSDAVGPGRGSAVGSLSCYCLRLTDVDPIRHRLLFSRFLSENRGGRSMKLTFTEKPLYKKSA